MVTGTMWRSNITTGKILRDVSCSKLLNCSAAKLKCLFKYEVLPAKPRVSHSRHLRPPPVISTITVHGGDIS